MDIRYSEWIVTYPTKVVKVHKILMCKSNPIFDASKQRCKYKCHAIKCITLQYIWHKAIFRQFNIKMFAEIEMKGVHLGSRVLNKHLKFLHTSKFSKSLINGNMQYIILKYI
jgi:hypothetical protein